MRKPPVAYPIPLRLLLRLGLARFPEKAESSRGHCCVEALGDGYLNRCGTGVKASSYFFSFPLFLLLLLYFPFLPSGGGEGVGRPAYTTNTHTHTTQDTKSSGGTRLWIIIREMRNTYFKAFSFSVSKRRRKFHGSVLFPTNALSRGFFLQRTRIIGFMAADKTSEFLSNARSSLCGFCCWISTVRFNLFSLVEKVG